MDRDAIIREVLSLSAADREYVVDILAVSLVDGLPPQLGLLEQREMLRRIEMFEEHPGTFVSWESVKARLAERRKSN
jgi:hypothetical protein